MLYYILLIIIISSFTFFVYGIDKRKSIKHSRRISEKTLLLLSLSFGAMGAIIGSAVFKHKSKKFKFKLLNGIFLCIHILIGVYLYK